MILKFMKNINNENNKINKTIPLFIIFLFVLLNIVVIFNFYFKENNKKNILRLHVVANSNSIEDQLTKLKVYQNISDYINNNLKNNDISSIEANIKNDYEKILTISNNILKENNKDYLTTLEVGKIYYDEKQSILIDMEKGTYDSVKVVLGNGEGKNIWSLISPNKENLEKIQALNTIIPNLDKVYTSNENIIKDNNITYDLKIIEFIENLKNNIENKMTGNIFLPV